MAFQVLFFLLLVLISTLHQRAQSYHVQFQNRMRYSNVGIIFSRVNFNTRFVSGHGIISQHVRPNNPQQSESGSAESH